MPRTTPRPRVALAVVLLESCSALHAAPSHVWRTPPPVARTSPIVALAPRPASNAALLLAGSLLTASVKSSCLHEAAVQTGLASLTLLDFRPTAKRQLTDAISALEALEPTDAAARLLARLRWRDRAVPAQVAQWGKLVRGKVFGELIGLGIALRAPCTGACVVMFAHLLFWSFGAAGARVDAIAEPAPLPSKLARMIATADAVVLAFAALGVVGPTPHVRAAGAWLFAASAAFVSAEQLPKLLAKWRERRASSSAASISVEDLPAVSVKGDALPPRRGAPPQMVLESAPAATAVRAEPSHAAWAEQWWPLCFAAHTSTRSPSPITLLGAPLVVWWDEPAGAWRCTLDRCSHRLAPLSEGRVVDGCIECPYHGWTFDGGGTCVRVPQQPEGASLNARRAAVSSLPCVEEQGVVWVWGGPLFDGAAVAPPPDDPGPATVAAIELDGVEHTDYSRDLHMDWSTLCENVMDPAHLPFTHHTTISNRAKAAPISFGPLEHFDPSGFAAARNTKGGPGRLTFRAPHLVLAETHRGKGSYSDWNVVYAIPTEPGRCRLLVRVVFEVSKLPIPLKWILTFAFTKQPTWLSHLGTHKILEDDNPFLHTQGHTYRADHPTLLAPRWAKRVYTPTQSDAMVVAFRKWIDRFTDGQGAPWSEHMCGTAARAQPPRASREVVLERYDSHVAHCQACSGALANMRRVRVVADASLAVTLLVAGLVARARTAALVLAAISAAVARVCATLDERMRVGMYPPPRNA